jgi:hypothetical protein
VSNARTLLFEVETAKLLEFLDLIKREGATKARFDYGADKIVHNDDPVGSLLDSGTGERVRVSLEELCDGLRRHGDPRITIEEQNWCEYVIRVGAARGGWVFLDWNSPAFVHVRRLHLDHRLPRTEKE